MTDFVIKMDIYRGRVVVRALAHSQRTGKTPLGEITAGEVIRAHRYPNGYNKRIKEKPRRGRPRRATLRVGPRVSASSLTSGLLFLQPRRDLGGVSLFWNCFD